MALAAADRYPCGRTDREKTMHEPMPSRTLALSRRSLLSAGGLLLAAWGMPAMAAPTQAMVYKNPWCGCCIGWVEHLEANGFAVTVEDSDDLAPVKARLAPAARVPQAPARLQRLSPGPSTDRSRSNHPQQRCTWFKSPKRSSPSSLATPTHP